MVLSIILGGKNDTESLFFITCRGEESKEH